MDQFLRDIGGDVSAQELAMVPPEHQMLFKEIRRNNNLLQGLIKYFVEDHNVLAAHDRQLTPLKIAGRICMAILAVAAGIAVVFGWIKSWLKSP